MLASQLVSNNSPALLLANPEAGGGRAAAFLPRIERFFESQSFQVEIVRTQSAEDLEARARAGIAAGRRLLIAMGGDGTFQGLANAAAGTNALLGLIPAGGGNDFAAALGLPKDPVAAARFLLDGEPRPMDLLRARTADGKVRLYCGGGGIGLDAETTRYASGIFRRFPGTLRYVASAICALREFSPLEVTVEFPGSEHPPVNTRVLLVGVLNTPTYGAGLGFAPDARADDGWLDVALVRRLGWLEVLDVLPRLAQRGNLEIPQIELFRAQRVRLTADRACVFHGDGEIFGPAPVEIEVASRAVRILAPRPAAEG